MLLPLLGMVNMLGSRPSGGFEVPVFLRKRKEWEEEAQAIQPEIEQPVVDALDVVEAKVIDETPIAIDVRPVVEAAKIAYLDAVRDERRRKRNRTILLLM